MAALHDCPARRRPSRSRLTIGAVYSLDNGVPVSKKLAADLVNPQRQGDLFLRPNDDGLFLGFTQTWRADE